MGKENIADTAMQIPNTVDHPNSSIFVDGKPIGRDSMEYVFSEINKSKGSKKKSKGPKKKVSKDHTAFDNPLACSLIPRAASVPSKLPDMSHQHLQKSNKELRDFSSSLKIADQLAKSPAISEPIGEDEKSPVSHDPIDEDDIDDEGETLADSSVDASDSDCEEVFEEDQVLGPSFNKANMMTRLQKSQAAKSQSSHPHA